LLKNSNWQSAALPIVARCCFVRTDPCETEDEFDRKLKGNNLDSHKNPYALHEIEKNTN